ncbi:MAG: chromosomal replication initiator protein DnaA [Eubacteriales bacterium]
MELQNDADLSEIWRMVNENMRESYKYSEQSYQLWFGRMQLSHLDAERAVFVCENEQKRTIIEKNYKKFITSSLVEVIGYEPVVEIGVDTSLAPKIPDDGSVVSPLKIVRERQAERERGRGSTAAPGGAEQLPLTAVSPSQAEIQKSRERDKPEGRDAGEPDDAGVTEVEFAEFSSSPDESRGERRLTYNEDYTFENFIVGNSNRFAHAAALNVADNVGMKVNPLFIYGPSGLGKTHLMYAIANRALKRKPDMKVIYVKGEEFMNQLILAIQRGWNHAFRQKYRSADMLLIDDIQFIAGKESTQTEFFHTFDALYEDHKQIILTSDRPPRELTLLEERIRSRFEAGLLADIQPPDYELRLAILKNKISQNHIDVPTDVVDFLARNLQENIRQLEGVIKKLAVSNLLTGQPVTMEMVIQTVPEYLRDAEPVSDTVNRIIDCVAKHYSVKVEDILGTSRTKKIKTARNVAMYIVRSVTNMSLPQMGVVFCRDHSTIHSNINAVETELSSDPVLDATINEITKEIKRG